jgi:hypothetical protein
LQKEPLLKVGLAIRTQKHIDMKASALTPKLLRLTDAGIQSICGESSGSKNGNTIKLKQVKAVPK